MTISSLNRNTIEEHLAEHLPRDKQTPEGQKAVTTIIDLILSLGTRDINDVRIKLTGDRITFENKSFFGDIYIWARSLFSSSFKKQYDFERNVSKIGALFSSLPAETTNNVQEIAAFRAQIFRLIDRVITIKTGHKDDPKVSKLQHTFDSKVPGTRIGRGIYSNKVAFTASSLEKLFDEIESFNEKAPKMTFYQRLVCYKHIRQEFEGQILPPTAKFRDLYLGILANLASIAIQVGKLNESKQYAIDFFNSCPNKSNPNYKSMLVDFCNTCIGQKDYDSLKSVLSTLNFSSRRNPELHKIKDNAIERCEFFKSLNVGESVFPAEVGVRLTQKQWEMIELAYNASQDYRINQQVPDEETGRKLQDFYVYIAGNEDFNKAVYELSELDFWSPEVKAQFGTHEELLEKCKSYSDFLGLCAGFSFKCGHETIFVNQVRLGHIDLIHKKAEKMEEIERLEQNPQSNEVRERVAILKSQVEDLNKELLAFKELATAELDKNIKLKEPLFPEDPTYYTPYTIIQADSLARNFGIYERVNFTKPNPLNHPILGPILGNIIDARVRVQWFKDKIDESNIYEAGDLALTDENKFMNFEKKTIQGHMKLYNDFVTAYGHVATVSRTEEDLHEPYAFTHMLGSFCQVPIKISEYLVTDFYRVDFSKILRNISATDRKTLLEIMQEDKKEAGGEVEKSNKALYQWLSEEYTNAFEEAVVQDNPQVELSMLDKLELPVTDDLDELLSWLEKENVARKEAGKNELSLWDIMQVGESGEVGCEWIKRGEERFYKIKVYSEYGQAPSIEEIQHKNRLTAKLAEAKVEFITNQFKIPKNTEDFRKRVFIRSRLMGGPIGAVVNRLEKTLDTSKFDFQKATEMCCSQFAALMVYKAFQILQLRMQKKYVEMMLKTRPKEQKKIHAEADRFFTLPSMSDSQFKIMTPDQVIKQMRAFVKHVDHPPFYKFLFAKADKVLAPASG